MAKRSEIHKDLLEVVDQLKRGDIGIIPTDTVYGLVVSARSKNGVEKMSHIKKREPKPGTIIAANIDQLTDLGFRSADLQEAAKFWPGAVSVILEAPPGLEYLHQGLNSLPARIPNNPQLIELLKQSGPLMTTSANLSGQPTVKNAKEAHDVFGDQIDFYVNEGNQNHQTASTIIRIDSGKIKVLRPGSVKVH